MKKLLLGLGALAAVVAPVASVIACDSKTDTPTTNVKYDEATGTFTVEAGTPEFEAIANKVVSHNHAITEELPIRFANININELFGGKMAGMNMLCALNKNLNDEQNKILNSLIGKIKFDFKEAKITMQFTDFPPKTELKDILTKLKDAWEALKSKDSSERGTLNYMAPGDSEPKYAISIEPFTLLIDDAIKVIS